MKDSSKVIIGALIGAAAGAIAGVLLAPDSGKETRKNLLKQAGELGDQIKNLANDSKDYVENLTSTIKESVATKASAVKVKSNGDVKV